MSRFLRVAFVLALVVFVAGVLGVSAYLERQGLGDPVPVDRPPNTPTESLRIADQSTPTVTASPAPDYIATEQSIEVQALRLTQAVQDFNADLTRQAESNANEATQQAQAVINTLGKISIEKETDNLLAAKTQHAQTTGFQATQQAQVIAKTDDLAAVEVRQAERYDTWIVNLKLIGLALAGGLALGVVGFFLALWMVNIIRGYQHDNTMTLERERLYHEAELDRISLEESILERAAKNSMIQDFVYAACRFGDPDYHQIPPNTKMDGWHAERWQRAVNLLKEDGMVYTSNQGTFIKSGTLGELRDSLESVEYPSERSER